MATRLLHRALVMSAVAPLVALLIGCSGADNPKMVEAPPYKPPENQQPPMIKGQKAEYGTHPRYKTMMDKMEKYHR
jgi:hypothetical protein